MHEGSEVSCTSCGYAWDTGDACCPWCKMFYLRVRTPEERMQYLADRAVDDALDMWSFQFHA